MSPSAPSTFRSRRRVLNLLRGLQEELSLSCRFIGHDFAVVRYLSHRIVVLYWGTVMETGPAEILHDQPSNPYTRALLAAAPVADPQLQQVRRQERMKLQVHANGHLDKEGCPYRSRCPFAIDICRVAPPLTQTPLGTWSAFHRTAELPPWINGSAVSRQGDAAWAPPKPKPVRRRRAKREA